MKSKPLSTCGHSAHKAPTTIAACLRRQRAAARVSVVRGSITVDDGRTVQQTTFDSLEAMQAALRKHFGGRS